MKDDSQIKKLEILVVAGGWSNEREISLMSGKNIFQCLEKNNFNVKFFDLSKKNIHLIFKNKPQLIFNALHGEFGEDGGLPYLAKKSKTPITHSNDLTSALCFNKRLLKLFLKKELNVLSPKEYKFKDKINFPIISKPNWGGSSKGISIIYDPKKISKIKFKDDILNEEVIRGKELTVTIIEDGNSTKALGVTEIEFDSQHYDYKAKYTKGGSRHHIPARITHVENKNILTLSKKIFSLCQCQSIARLDFILSKKNKKFYFLEINTHPGLTKLSLAPEQALHQNLNYLNLLKKIIISSL